MCLYGAQVLLFLTDWPFCLLQGALVHDVAEHWQQEGYGFSTASLSDANEVSARHNSGNGLGLDRCGLLVTVSEDGIKVLAPSLLDNPFRMAQLRKFGNVAGAALQ